MAATKDSVAHLVEDLTEIRHRLEAAVRANRDERSRIEISFAALGATLHAVKTGRSAYAGSPLPSTLPKEVQSAKTVSSDLNVLTAREKEVLRLIAEGNSTKEIAWKLNISFKTAVSHRTHLLQKMGVHETASLVRMAIRSGLVA
jgi:DNA-binding NarL/FixJ family response regulator